MRRGLLLFFVVYAAFWFGAVLANRAPPTPPPRIPALSDTFHDPELIYYEEGLGFVNYTAWQYFDKANPSSQVMSLIGAGSLNGFPIEEIGIYSETQSYQGLNGICRTLPGGSVYLAWSNLFQGATFSGEANITQPAFNRTVSCQMWTLRSGVAYVADDTPIRLVLGPSITADFSPGYQPDPLGLTPSSGVFKAPDSCYALYNCSGEGEATQLEVYNYHNVGDFFLNNTNTADTVGDAFFVCETMTFGNAGSYQWISQWQVEVNSSFGQYALCNSGVCFGGDTHRVGKEGSFGYGQDHGGQCTSNDDLGNWYSFPGTSQCQENQEIGDDVCTWKVLTKVKTINATCLLDSTAFSKACQEDALEGKLDELSNVFSQAFSSDDPSQGGCPPVDLEAEIGNAQPKGTFTKAPSSMSYQHRPSLLNLLRHFGATRA